MSLKALARGGSHRANAGLIDGRRPAHGTPGNPRPAQHAGAQKAKKDQGQTLVIPRFTPDQQMAEQADQHDGKTEPDDKPGHWRLNMFSICSGIKEGYWTSRTQGERGGGAITARATPVTV